jgi:hypothetical protein
MYKKRGIILVSIIILLFFVILTSAQPFPDSTGCCLNPALPDIVCTQTTFADCGNEETFFAENTDCSVVPDQMCNIPGTCFGANEPDPLLGGKYCFNVNHKAECIDRAGFVAQTNLPECTPGCCICKDDLSNFVYDSRNPIKSNLEECTIYCEDLVAGNFYVDTYNISIQNPNNCIIPIEPVCGNDICDKGETVTCPDDCILLPLKINLVIDKKTYEVGEEVKLATLRLALPKAVICGDGICEEGENTTNCPDDCLYPPCDLQDPDCEKAQALFQLITPQIIDAAGIIKQGVFDKDKDFTVHQFAVVYDALMNLTDQMRSTLNILIFTNKEGEAAADPDAGKLNLGYGPSMNYWNDDPTLFCTTIHEMAHIIETQMNALKQYRGICYTYNTEEETWQIKPECNPYWDFAPQITEDGWSDALRARSSGADGREDIANAFSYYVCGGDFFRAETMNRIKMLEKYQFIRELFGGKEFKCEIDGCPEVTPEPTPCENNGCVNCLSAGIGAACTTACGDCPAFHSCSDEFCKYLTCENNRCNIMVEIIE